MRPGADQRKIPETKPREQDELKSLPMPEFQIKLGSMPDGLSQAEAQKRLLQYGPNEIEDKKTNPLLQFLTYFWGPIPWMIEAAVILSAVARHWPDFVIIFLLLVANAVVGFWPKKRRLSPGWLPLKNWRAWVGCPVLRQDRHPDPEQVDTGRAGLCQLHTCRSGCPQRRTRLTGGGQGHHRPRRVVRAERRYGAARLAGCSFPAL